MSLRGGRNYQRPTEVLEVSVLSVVTVVSGVTVVSITRPT